MAGFPNSASIKAAFEAGRVVRSSFRKLPSQTTVTQWWSDFSMSAGTPPLNFYTTNPLDAAVLNGFKGIYRGDDVSPAAKCLQYLSLMTPTAGLVGKYKLLDYVLYYPTIDLDDTGTQSMDNTVTLPRYTDGDNLNVMLVNTVPTAGTGGTFTFSYINQDGVAKTSPIQNISSASSGITSIPSSQPAIAGNTGPFLTLAAGDRGVRSITAWNSLSPLGGFGTLVLVRCLADIEIREVNTVNYVTFPMHDAGMPVIPDGAYLGLIGSCSATVAGGILMGAATFVWSE